MSIMRRHSHGCHRLHNHLAVRLMSFVLAHRHHTRVGQQHFAFRLPLEQDNEEYTVEIDEGGYVFNLERPVPVERARGPHPRAPSGADHLPIPKYSQDAGAYVLPDGGAIAYRNGQLVSVPLPPPAVMLRTVAGGGRRPVRTCRLRRECPAPRRGRSRPGCRAAAACAGAAAAAAPGDLRHRGARRPVTPHGDADLHPAHGGRVLLEREPAADDAAAADARYRVTLLDPARAWASVATIARADGRVAFAEWSPGDPPTWLLDAGRAFARTLWERAPRRRRASWPRRVLRWRAERERRERA